MLVSGVCASSVESHHYWVGEHRSGVLEKVKEVDRRREANFSISKRMRILGVSFFPQHPASHQNYFTNLTLTLNFAEFNESNFIISIKN